jgi:rod shape-determining protein MreD
MATLIAIPILSLLTVFQSAIVSRVPLLQGSPDLVLLVLIAWSLQERVRHTLPWSLVGGLCVGFVSIIPISIPILSYTMITGFVRLIRQRLWENSILAMFATTFLGSIIHQSIIGIYLSIRGTSLPIIESLRLILLPSLILNLILAAPIFAVVKDLAEWVYPEEIKI